MSKKLKPVFVNTTNVRNFEVMMEALDAAEGEGRLGMVFGQAGRGKTRTAQRYAAHNGCVYLRMATVWRSSELEFLKALCKELGITHPPHRKGPAFAEAVDRLISDPRPVFLDEIEKLPRHFMDVVRDLSDLSGAAFVLIGEEELVPCMQRNRRVWSRTYRQLEFKPITTADVLAYARQAADLALDPDTAAVIHKDTAGDFRLVRADILNLMQIAAANGGGISPDMACVACRQRLRSS